LPSNSNWTLGKAKKVISLQLFEIEMEVYFVYHDPTPSFSPSKPSPTSPTDMSWITLARLSTSRSVNHCIRVDRIRAVACRSFHSGKEIGPIDAGVTNFDTLGNCRNIGRRRVYERISISSQVNIATYLDVDTERRAYLGENNRR
jgi:hypothetical protein